MKLGLMLSYSGARLSLPLELVAAAERLGFDSVWTAETYGSDALSPLAFLAAHTRDLRLVTGVMQLAGRTPANCAMAVQTIDALAGGGRVVAGVGVSGPQIVEGWYGQPWGKPYYRLRDYVTIMRKIFAREEPVTHGGREIALPYAGPGSTGMGKPLKSILHPNPALPIWLGTDSESMVKLTAEIADGWIPFRFVPETMPTYLPWLQEGFRRARTGKSLADFEIFAETDVVLSDDVAAGFDYLRPKVALYVGGMGHRDKNYSKDHMSRLGFAEDAVRIQELFLAGRKAEAAAAVPDEYCDARALVGPASRIRRRYADWQASGITGLTIRPNGLHVLPVIAEIAGLRPRPNTPAMDHATGLRR